MRDDVRKVLIVLIFAALRGAQPAAAQPVPAEGRLDYAIVRNGDQIGTHAVTFRREGDQLIVDINVNIQVRVFGITAYRFTQAMRETWRDGRLLMLDSSGNDDGTPYAVQVREVDGGLVAESGGRRVRFPAESVPSDVWNPAQLQREVLIDTIGGTARRPTVRDNGERSFTANGQAVTARGSLLEVAPDYRRWFWFDANGRLVHMELRGSDGSLVEYRLQGRGIAAAR
jgi:hypothetical protein